MGQHRPRRRQLDRRQPLWHPSAQALRPRTNTGTSAPNASPRIRGGRTAAQAPQPIQRHQDGGGIRRAPTEAAAHRNALFDADIDTLRALGVILQQFRGTHEQVVGFGDTVRRLPIRRTRPSARGRKPHLVAPVQQAEHGLQGVVAVRAPAGDAQEQVQLRRRPAAPTVASMPALARPCAGHSSPQRSTSTRTGPRRGCVDPVRHRLAAEGIDAPVVVLQHQPPCSIRRGNWSAPYHYAARPDRWPDPPPPRIQCRQRNVQPVASRSGGPRRRRPAGPPDRTRGYRRSALSCQPRRVIRAVSSRRRWPTAWSIQCVPLPPSPVRQRHPSDSGPGRRKSPASPAPSRGCAGPPRNRRVGGGAGGLAPAGEQHRRDRSKTSPTRRSPSALACSRAIVRVQPPRLVRNSAVPPPCGPKSHSTWRGGWRCPVGLQRMGL